MPKITQQQRRVWWRAFFCGIGLHLLSWPLLAIFAYGSAMSAFTHDRPQKQRLYWTAPPPSVLERIWMGGYMITSAAADYLIFGSPLPPAPVNPNFSDPDAEERLKRMSDAWYPEYQRRKSVYRVCWLLNEVIFGAVIATLFVIVFYRRSSDNGTSTRQHE